MTSEGSEHAKRRDECNEHIDADEFRQQMRELVEEVKEQVHHGISLISAKVKAMQLRMKTNMAMKELRRSA